MNSKNFENTKFAMQKGIEKDLYPSIDLALVKDGETVFAERIGCYENQIFDLASLTKPLITGFILLQALSEKKIHTDDVVEKYLDFLPHQLHKLRILEIMSHCSGLAAHHNWFKEIASEFGGPEKLLETDIKKRVNWYKNRFENETLIFEPGKKTKYSDLGYWLLAWILESAYEESFEKLAYKKIINQLELRDTFFIQTLKRTLPHKEIERLIPTENCPWRGNLKGEVHDDNCWAMGGVAGHAGLFSNISDLIKIAKTIQKGEFPGVNEGVFKWSKKQLIEPRNSTRTPIWDTPSENHSSVGELWDKRSFGWMGFTGTSFWTDPSKNLTAIILTNRVHPSREEKGFRQYRSVLHTAIMKDFLEAKE